VNNYIDAMHIIYIFPRY